MLPNDRGVVFQGDVDGRRGPGRPVPSHPGLRDGLSAGRSRGQNLEE